MQHYFHRCLQSRDPPFFSFHRRDELLDAARSNPLVNRPYVTVNVTSKPSTSSAIQITPSSSSTIHLGKTTPRNNLSCQFCERKFSHPRSLKSHLLWHSNQLSTKPTSKEISKEAPNPSNPPPPSTILSTTHVRS